MFKISTKLVLAFAVVLASGCASSPKRSVARQPSTVAVAEPGPPDVKLPGISLSVPDWPVKVKDEEFSGGVFRIERAAGAEQIQLGWFQDDTPLTDKFIENTIAGMKSGGLDVELARSYSGTVARHSSTTYELVSKSPPNMTVFVTHWHCTDHGRHFQLRSILLTKASHQKVLESIKCHLGQTGSRTQVPFAKFDAPAGVTLSAEQPDRIVYSSDFGSVILLRGLGGSIGRALLTDTSLGRDARAKFLSSLAETLSLAPATITHYKWPKQAEAGRPFVNAELTVEGMPSVLVMTFVDCKAQATVFPAAFLGLASTPRADVAELLLRASCPTR
jgi:hypothetical protein